MDEIERLIYKEFEKTIKTIIYNDFNAEELEELREKMEDSRSILFIINRLADMAFEMWTEENATNAGGYSSIYWACILTIENI